MRKSAINLEIGCLWGGFPCTTKAGTPYKDRPAVFQPRNRIPVGWLPVYDESRVKRTKTDYESTKIQLHLERFDCTTSVGYNFWTDRLRGQKMQFSFLGPMLLPAQRACSLAVSWETGRRVTSTRVSLACAIAVLHHAIITLSNAKGSSKSRNRSCRGNLKGLPRRN
jgi:hypothetical protein